MSTYFVIIQSQAMPGREEEYRRWYDGKHLGDICAISGVVSGGRYQPVPGSPARPDLENIGVFELETDDPAKVLALMGQTEGSAALDSSSPQIWILENAVS